MPARDAILSALAQNGALRLQCDSALISSIDGLSHQVVAEANSSSSLCGAQPEPSPAHQAERESYLEHQLAQSVRVFTDAAPPLPDTPNVTANSTRHLIRNLHALKHSQNKVNHHSPCDTTSYAAVPIRNATGQLLGCYCVTDWQTRDDFFSENTYTILADIASAIAQYFDQHHLQNNHHSRSIDQSSLRRHASRSESATSGRSLSQATSCDVGTPLTTPSEAPEFPFPTRLPRLSVSKSSSKHQSTAASRRSLSPTDLQPSDHSTVSAEEATKSDFVSSLSHELRSPLHGCLAAVELLQETTLDRSQRDLLAMVQACSSTLLYTLNHLLDYSKVNDLENLGHQSPSGTNVSRTSSSQNKFGEASNDFLCRVAQDVVEGVFFGHTMQQAAYNKMQESPPSNHAESRLDPALLLDSAGGSTSATVPDTVDGVAVFLYMDSSAAWFSMVSAGAWKRLIMNLFGNSLKFCSDGYIEVTLKLVPDQSDLTKRMAHLTVHDTGLGMSEDFLKRGLYEPFVQENHLIAGTGLGLNIVKRIIDEMQGAIHVKSTLGSGTQFDVLVPVVEPEAHSDHLGPVLDGGQILDPSGLLLGLTICLLSSTTVSSEKSVSRTSLVHSYVKDIADNWYHMKVTSADMAADLEANFYIAEASDFTTHARSNVHTSQAALKQRTILVGTPSQLTQAKRVFTGNFLALTYPLGPRALARALYAALERPEDLDYPPLSTSITKITPDRMEIDTILPQPDLSIDCTEGINTKSPTKQHLLLVDDNAINLKLLSTFIKKLNLPAKTAVDGADALAKYKAMSATSAFTTILMDISMPKMNGFESSRAIREFEDENGLPRAKIIALTALSSEASRREAETSGIDDFQMKPVSLKTLKGLFPEAAASA
ncbi:hypothetical protein D6D01_07604 [Aureobasidium pullulans]|uniref:Uncharacterized protein n=1 Tax=Aureobasidium pullulans TaxID=5580 RepID=A0A4S9KME5_AURPU|nr:hypothetical protein D6D01_07604 [Aureobasidium pullulans]